MSGIVAIVGRPNVGKSTFFNRMIGERRAIVDAVAGVTRDRTYGQTDWNGKRFTLIDSGGYVMGSDDVFEAEIRKQVRIAVEEADVILFVVDVTEGVTGDDEAVAELLRKTSKPVLLVVNKVDGGNRLDDATEFYSLGLGDYFCISSMSGSGTGDLLDAVAEHLQPDVEEDDADEPALPRIAIVGRPNVGKSSLTNALLGEERNIVTSIAGTTRDSVDSHYKGFGHEFILIDTAGIRKKNKVEEDLEFYSVMRSIRAIEAADVCVLVIDATVGFDAQDMNIVHLAQKNGKGLLVAVNKWDLVEKDTLSTKNYTEAILKKMEPFTDVPVLFISAVTKQRILKLIEEAKHVFDNRNRKIPTRKLNDALLPIIENSPPPSGRGLHVKVKFVTQLPTRVPSFAFFCNHPREVKDPYKRFIENRMRELFDFSGVPFRIFFREK